MPLGHKNYFELKAIKSGKCEKSFPYPPPFCLKVSYKCSLHWRQTPIILLSPRWHQSNAQRNLAQWVPSRIFTSHSLPSLEAWKLLSLSCHFPTNVLFFLEDVTWAGAVSYNFGWCFCFSWFFVWLLLGSVLQLTYNVIYISGVHHSNSVFLYITQYSPQV